MKPMCAVAGTIISGLMALSFTGCAQMQRARMQHDALAYHATLKDSPLHPYLLCGAGDGLVVAALHGRGRGEPSFRIVSAAGQTDTISIIEGYRTMYAYPDQDYFFANVKFEASRPSRYQADKASLIRFVENLSEDTTGTRSVYSGPQSRNGYAVYGDEAIEIDKTSTMGLYIVFAEARQAVVSVYLLNQGQKARRFTNIEEYRTLRDSFLQRLITCMEKADSPVEERVP